MNPKIILSVLCIVLILACNKIEPKKFHENTCESISQAPDSVIIEQTVIKMTATKNADSELWLRLKGTTQLDFDSLSSHWIQIKSSNECYQANTFKSRTELGETYIVVDYIVPTFVHVGYPCDWKFTYKGVPYYLHTVIQK